MRSRAPLTPAQRAHAERALRAEHDARTLARAGEPRISRSDEQELTDRVRAVEAATRERELAEHAAQAARLLEELARVARSMKQDGLVDRGTYCAVDRDLRSLAVTVRRLVVSSAGGTL